MNDKKLNLHIGCGRRRIKNFVNVDIDPEVKPDLILDCSKQLPWRNEVDLILSIHNIEHYEKKDIPQILKNWYDALKPNGELYISTPDFKAVCTNYITNNSDMRLYQGFLVGGQRNDFDQHHIIFDFDYLKKYLEETGFKNIERYDWKETEWKDVDSYERAMLPGFDFVNGRLMSLNIKAKK